MAGIDQCAKTGCSNTPIDIIDDNADASVTYSPGAIGLDTTNVYFVDYDGNGNTAGIRSVPISAAHGVVTTLAGAAKLCPNINHGRVYLPYMYFTCDDGRIGRLQLTTKTVEFLSAAGAPMNPDEFVSDGTSVYYGEFVVAASIYQMPIVNDAGSTPIALSQPYINGMALDGNYLYWVNIGAGMDNGDGTLVRCAFSGCSGTVQTIASFIDLPTDVEVDQTSLFYAAWGNGNTPHTGIWAMPKPP